MKRVFFPALVAFFCFSAMAADWTFDSSANTIDDGDWTFAVTKVSGTDLTIGACSKYPETASLLDFSKAISDGETSYDIVALNTALGTVKNGYGHDGAATDAGAAVSELRFSDGGKLTTIGTAAFCCITNCTKITPLVPDSVTTVGVAAFYGCKAAQDVRLYGISTLNYSVFNSAKVTSVTFGPNLKSMWAAWNGCPFMNCTSLTNVAFDAEMSGGYIDGRINGGVFDGCSKLTGTLDLRGFSRLNYYAFPNTKYETVLLGSNLTELASSAFRGMTSLNTVKFYGAPPATLGTPVFDTLASSQIITSYVMSEDESVQSDWAAKTAGGVLNKLDSTWHADYVVSGSVANRYLVLPSGGGGETGFWVFDDDTKKLSSGDGKWEFSASRSFIKLTIGSCTKWPTVVDELDFSKSITTSDGTGLVLYELNTAFATTPGQTGYAYFANGNPTITEAAQYVGRLVLPTEGLEMIDRGAFAGCTALTNVVNYIPDTVTYLGYGAFFKVPAAQDVSLYNVPRVGYQTFGYAGLTSVTFGPNLNYLHGFYANGIFVNCTALTNVYFDAGISGATIDSSSEGVFAGCSALTGRLDLRGFTDIGESLNLSSTRLQDVVIGDAVKSLNKDFFYNNSTITNVIFLGRPPLTIGTPYLNGCSANRTIMTTVYADYLKVTNSAGKCWRDYANSRNIWPSKTTWASDYVASGIDLKYRPLICPDGEYSGLILFIR